MFLNLMLSLIHPELHTMGLEILQQLQNLPSTTRVTSELVSAYTGIQVISNHLTPGHWDSKGRPEWYDLLTSIGRGSLPHLRVNDIGFQLAYHPGSLVCVGLLMSMRLGMGLWGPHILCPLYARCCLEASRSHTGRLGDAEHLWKILTTCHCHR
jgi:hypothetical protein